MALEPNILDFRGDEVLVSPTSSAASLMNRMHDISFQSGAISSSSIMVAPMVGDYFRIEGGMNSDNSSVIINSSGMGQACAGSSSSGGFLLDTVPEPKHDVGLDVDWTADEQLKLDKGIKRYGGFSMFSWRLLDCRIVFWGRLFRKVIG